MLVGLMIVAMGLWPVGRWWAGSRLLENRPHFCIEMFSDTDSVAQLFYDGGEGINEAQSDTLFVRHGQINRLVFTVSVPVIKGIRFDPLTSGGTVRISRVWYEDATGTRVIELPTEGFKPANQIASITQTGAAVTVVMPAGVDDPQLVRSWATPLVFPGRPPPWMAIGLLVAGLGAVVVALSSRKPITLSGAGAAAVGVALVTVTFLWPLHRTLDYPLWDEANYLGWGQNFWRTGNLGEIAGSPGYHLWYAALSTLWGGGAAIFASQYALKGLLAGLTLVVARRWFDSWLVAGLVAVSVALSQWQLTFPLLVYHAAFACFLGAIAVADRSRWAAIGLLALAALTRLEYAFAAMVTVTLWWAVWRRTAVPGNSAERSRRSLGMKLGAFLPLLLAAYATWHVQGWALGGQRGWFAFQQHYTVGLAETGQLPGLNPWLDYPGIIKRDFPGAHSLAEAWRINQGAVMHHLGRNLAAVPARLGDFFITPHPGRYGWMMALTLGLAALAGAATFSSGGQLSFADWVRPRRWGIAVTLAGAVATLPGMMVYAKTAYLLPMIPLVWLLIAVSAAWVRSNLPATEGHARSWVGAVGLTLIGSAVALTAPRPLAVPQAQPVRQDLAVIRRECPPPARLLGLGSESYAVYLGPGYAGIEPLNSGVGRASTGPEATLAQLLEYYHPDAILVTDMWRASAFLNSKELDGLLKQGWRKVPLAEGELYLARTVPSPSQDRDAGRR